MLVSEIRDEIITEVGGDTADTGLQTRILQFMKAALRRFPRHIRERALTDKLSVALALNATTLTLPSGLVREREVYYEKDGSRNEIILRNTRDFNELYRGNSTGAPQYYRIYGRTAEFNVKADQAYTIFFEGFKEIDAVSAADTWAHTSDIAEILKDGAKFYYFKYQEDSSNAADFLALFKAGLDQMDAEYLAQEVGDYVEEA